jgi:hypothetical protein
MNTCGNVAGHEPLVLHLIHFSLGVSCPDSVLLLADRRGRGGRGRGATSISLACKTRQACAIVFSIC